MSIKLELSNIAHAINDDAKKDRRFALVFIISIAIVAIVVGTSMWRLITTLSNNMQSMSDDMKIMVVEMHEMKTHIKNMDNSMSVMSNDIQGMNTNILNMSTSIDNMDNTTKQMNLGVEKMDYEMDTMNKINPVKLLKF